MSFAGAKANLESLNRYVAQPHCVAAACSHLLAVPHITVGLTTLAPNHSAVHCTKQARSSARATYLRVPIALQ